MNLNRIKNYLDQTWILGRRNESYHIRFYPNPGFTFSFFKWQYRWNKKDGFKVRRTR